MNSKFQLFQSDKLHVVKRNSQLPRDGRHLFISSIINTLDLSPFRYNVKELNFCSGLAFEFYYIVMFGFILFAGWGKKRDVVIVKPDHFEEKRGYNNNNNGVDDNDNGDDESSGDSKQVRGSQRSEIAQVKTQG